ncbi:MAG: 1,2-phenylacetyl-CoA epoxidase subunit B [Bacteroidetes bacterium]|nr:1,2-phenylacetyl-CoA epoxidase subunit B [Bacteroidota bacterium]
MASLDPRVNRLDLKERVNETPPHAHWQTFEVFHQKKRGDQATHVGIVHAPSPELALVFAKEQFGRRQRSSNIWVVRSSEIYTFRTNDEDMFETTPEKIYREATGYRVRDKIIEFKKKQKEA